ncbi:hypothetical protein AYI68_g2197 [Smittium mucronatum]|uniref:Uncharacterized protein n=1 Tax=Smittium mucronatum TaxID=133383 RepID=A0A1R0H3F5_9FUNG|nr:hypothetical protein AYI68_g2197 [Smittium mucronatum]
MKGQYEFEPALPKGNGLAGHRVNHSAKVTMRRPGIEPGSAAWQAAIIPLNHLRMFVDEKYNLLKIIEIP